MNRPPQVLALMHLSQESNSPSLVRETVEHLSGLNHERYAETKFSVASQDLPGERLFVETTLPKKLKNKMLLQKTFENLLDGSTG